MEAYSDIIDDDGYFHFSLMWDDAELIHRLKRVDFSNVKPLKFLINFDYQPSPSDSDIEIYGGENFYRVQDAFSELFDYFHENDIVWDSLDLSFDYCHDYEHAILSWLLCKVNARSLFREISMDTREQVVAFDHSKVYEFELNKRLKALYLYGYLFTEQEGRDFGWFLRSTSSLKMVNFVLSPEIHKAVCQGLSRNNSLERIYLESTCGDAELSKVMTILSRHTKLRDLCVFSSEYGDLSSQAIEKFLEQSQLSVLALKKENGARGYLNAGSVVRGLRKNRSLEKLEIGRSVLFGDLPLLSLLSTLRDCPNLQMLKYDEETITAQELDQVILMKRLPRPIALSLTRDVLQESPYKIQQLLHEHPEVRLGHGEGSLYYTSCMSVPTCSDGSMLPSFNWNGRYLMDRPGVPSSIWPRLIERVKDNPSLIYKFLKGPAFGERKETRNQS